MRKPRFERFNEKKAWLRSEHQTAYKVDDDFDLHRNNAKGSWKGCILPRDLAMQYFNLKISAAQSGDWSEFRLFASVIRRAYNKGAYHGEKQKRA